MQTERTEISPLLCSIRAYSQEALFSCLLTVGTIAADSTAFAAEQAPAGQKIVVGESQGSLIGNNNSNVTIINVWGGDKQAKYVKGGIFAFPTGGSARMSNLVSLASSEDFKAALRPFAALGTLQPSRSGALAFDRSGESKPISYKALVAAGALNDNVRGQSRLVLIAVSSRDKMRPRWPIANAHPNSWLQDDKLRKLVQDAQKWIRDYNEEMVQLGMLSD